MQFAVLLHARPDGAFQAVVPAIPGLSVTAATRDQALHVMRSAIAGVFGAGELVMIDAPMGVTGIADAGADAARAGGDGTSIAEVTVLIHTDPDGLYRARIPERSSLVVRAATRDQVVRAVAAALATSDPPVVPVIFDVNGPDGTPNPWLATYGIFADDPTWDAFIDEMRLAREREDAELHAAWEREDEEMRAAGKRDVQTA